MTVVRLPAILAQEARGRAEFETHAATLGEALRGLPIADLLFDGKGDLRPLVNVYVDGNDARAKLDGPLADDATVRVVAAIAGG
jgi:molybdopterin converting factor small subunit